MPVLARGQGQLTRRLASHEDVSPIQRTPVETANHVQAALSSKYAFTRHLSKMPFQHVIAKVPIKSQKGTRRRMGFGGFIK